MRKKYVWEEVFLDATSRLDSKDCPTKIAAARALIDARVQELLTLGHHEKERIALLDALFALHYAEQYRRDQSSSERTLRAAG